MKDNQLVTDKIDLDAIIIANDPREGSGAFMWHEVKAFMKEAIHQALVLASENATLCDYKYNLLGEPYGMANLGQEVTEDGVYYFSVDKQSILDIEKLIV